MKDFNDLDFKTRKDFFGGIRAELMFDNGFGVSVIQSENSYGGSEGFYELAVLDSYRLITYDTPITADVEGWLSDADVTRLMEEVQSL